MNMITDEDRTAWKLKGYNVLIKFKDGELMPIQVDFSEFDAPIWFCEAEQFINGGSDIESFNAPGIALSGSEVKYIIKI